MRTKILNWPVLVVALFIGCSKPPPATSPATNPHAQLIVQLATFEAVAETGIAPEKLRQQLIDFRTERKLHPLSREGDVTADLIEANCEFLLVAAEGRAAYIANRGEDPARVNTGRNAEMYQLWRDGVADSTRGLKQFSAELRARLLTNNLEIRKSGN